MRFDDRLLTVLRQPAEDRHDAAVRWRQLVDLVARAGAHAASAAVTEALQAIRRDAVRVEEPVRAAAARAIAALPLPLSLVEYFVSDTLAVAAPVLAAASLDVSQWRVLAGAANDETRAFISTLHPAIQSVPGIDEKPITTSAESPAKTQAAQPGAVAAQPAAAPSLQDVIERIERRRQLRSGESARALASSEGDAGPPALFRWECGPGGDIGWVEGAPRGPLVGRSIAKQPEHGSDRVDPEVVRAFAVRSPFRDGMLQVGGAGPVAGAWKISGVPAFEPSDGRFAGYRGVALREIPAPQAAPSPEGFPEVLADPASLRELVHELKTPLNAIMGFAEIIEGQYLGPADRGYRDRAAEIGRQARLLLSAIDDLDFVAKVHSSAGGQRERVDLAALLDRAAVELSDMATKRGLRVEVMRSLGAVFAGVEPELADRLVLRLFKVLADCAEHGETLRLNAEPAGDGPQLTVSRPVMLSAIAESELFGPPRGEGIEAGFSLRLVRGLARIAGGDLIASRDRFVLRFAKA